jgi:hypothetical protein
VRPQPARGDRAPDRWEVVGDHPEGDRGGQRGGAEEVAKQFPQAQTDQRIAAAQQAFVDGKTAAILFAVIAAVIGLVLVLFLYPNKQDEEATYARVAGQPPDPGRDAEPEPEPTPGPQAAEPDPPP